LTNPCVEVRRSHAHKHRAKKKKTKKNVQPRFACQTGTDRRYPESSADCRCPENSNNWRSREDNDGRRSSGYACNNYREKIQGLLERARAASQAAVRLEGASVAHFNGRNGTGG